MKKTSRDKAQQQESHESDEKLNYSLVRYREELHKMDHRTRKLLTMQNALQPRDDIDRLYMSRIEGWQGLVSIKDSVYTSIRRHEEAWKK